MNTTAWISAVITVVTAPDTQPPAHTLYQAGQAAYQSQHVTKPGLQEQAQGILRDELRILQSHTDLNPAYRRTQP
jgi:hypothetical protein